MSSSQNRENSFFPEEFFCPIALEIFVDPVIACGERCAMSEFLSITNRIQIQFNEHEYEYQDGHTYERAEISAWLRHNSTSPISNAELQHKQLVPNHALKRLIADWRVRLAPLFDAASAAAADNDEAAPAAPSGQSVLSSAVLPRGSV